MPAPGGPGSDTGIKLPGPWDAGVRALPAVPAAPAPAAVRGHPGSQAVPGGSARPSAVGKGGAGCVLPKVTHLIGSELAFGLAAWLPFLPLSLPDVGPRFCPGGGWPCHPAHLPG